jgi:hypothetical protein
MGDNVDSSNVMLPTTRWWKRRQRRQGVLPTMPRTNGDRAPRSAGKHRPRWRRALTWPLRCARKSLGFLNRILDETYREAVAACTFRRGTIVLFDRHFILDYYHFDIDPQAGKLGLKRRLHGLFLRWFSRPPDLVICLDAPGEVVFQRKGEFSPEFLEMRRQQYRQFQHLVDHFELIDADRDLDLVVRDVSGAILRFQQERAHG